MDNKKKTKITKDLVIGALALRCPNRRGGGVFRYCDCGDGHRTNCNPRLCSWTIDFFRDMAAIDRGEKEWE